jgi:hypothetical protein
MAAICIWCGKEFVRRHSGGSAQKFCRPEHRNAFWATARRWAERAIGAGVMTVADLRRSPGACTLARAAVNGTGGHHVTVSLDVPPRAVELLRSSGWLAKPANSDAIADALIDLIDYAVSSKLRRRT